MSEEPDRTNPFIAKSLGKGDTGTKAQANNAKDRANAQKDSLEMTWPTNPAGKPLVRITMTAAELIPTGQYANVSIGPAQIEAFIDPDSDVGFPKEQRENIANALNELAEIVEIDVISVQRNLVLESLQEQQGK